MSRRALILPDLGLGDRPISVSMWLVDRGVQVFEGDPLVELLAGEATVDLPSPATGVLVKKLATEDDVVRVGQRLAVIETLDDEEPAG